MNIGLSMNKIKELTGGGGATGVTPWKEFGSATGTTQIQLPSKWLEIKIVTCNSSGLACYSTTMTYEEYQNNVSGKTYFSTFEGYNDSNFAKWCCYPTYLYLEDYHYAGDQTTKCTTTLYYKEVLENVINVGTESNWELWGETTGKNFINLPTEWSELEVCILGPTNTYLGKVSLTYEEHIKRYQNALNTSNTYYLTRVQMNNASYVSWLFYENRLALTASDTADLSTLKTVVYYKKKCDNVVDINDMGEWKLQGTNTSTTAIKLPSEFKELKVVSIYNDNTSYKLYFSKYLSKIFIDNIGTNDFYFGNTLMTDSNDSGSCVTWKFNKTSNQISVQSLLRDGSNGSPSYLTNYIYYR